MRRPPRMSSTVCWPPNTTTETKPHASTPLMSSSNTDCRPVRLIAQLHSVTPSSEATNAMGAYTCQCYTQAG